MHSVLGPLFQYAVMNLSLDTVITYTIPDKKFYKLHLRILRLNLPVLRVHIAYFSPLQCPYYIMLDMSVGNKKIIKVKKSLCRSGQALRIPGDCGSQSSSNSTHEIVKVVSPTHQPPLLSRINSFYSFLLGGCVDSMATVRQEGFRWKIPMTLSGIDFCDCLYCAHGDVHTPL